MSRPQNLADPEFEPSDAQLNDLAAAAFARVKQEREAALENLRRRIAVARAEALRNLADRPVRRKGPA